MVDCSFIIFGFTGDLSKRKLLPGLYDLIKAQKIKNFCIIGVGLEDKTVDEVLENSKKYINNLDPKIFELIKSRTHYVKTEITKKSDFSGLKSIVKQLEAKHHLVGNRLVYCATPSFVYSLITQHLVAAGILKRKAGTGKPWYRIAYEKPFGYDLKSAKKINKDILALLDESQVFRVDHYLAKELVENILYIRFTNYIFKSIWNNKHIDSVQIILSESLGLEGRGAYYDQVGALSDIVQNHLLQLLALVAMDEPKKLVGDDIRNCKAKILKKVTIEDGLLGQYEDYQQEKGVQPNSSTETFVLLKAAINTPAFKGVPFYITTGKHLKQKETKINIQFKAVDCNLTSAHCPIESNYLTIDLFPKGGFSFEVNAKKPGVRDEVIPVLMDFCYDCLFIPSTPHAYEAILQDIVAGDQAISVRFDEIELSWKITDSIKKMNLPLYTYQKNSDGPEEVKKFAKKYEINWK